MTNYERYNDALKFATLKHKGQFRKGGLEYVTHPIAVAKKLEEKGYSEEYVIAGLFHDLLEDTDATESEILKIGGEKVLTAVKLLTKEKGYVMDEYVSKIRENSIAKAVKAMDRLHNLECAIVCEEGFKRRYILETIDYYMDFDEEIPSAVKRLADTLETPIRSGNLTYEPMKARETLRANSFVLRGDICFSKESNKLEKVKDGYVVCVDGISKGIYKKLPKEYKDLKLIDYSDKLIVSSLVFEKANSFNEGYEFSVVVLDYPKDLSIEKSLERLAYAKADVLGIIAKYVQGEKII